MQDAYSPAPNNKKDSVPTAAAAVDELPNFVRKFAALRCDSASPRKHREGPNSIFESVHPSLSSCHRTVGDVNECRIDVQFRRWLDDKAEVHLRRRIPCLRRSSTNAFAAETPSPRSADSNPRRIPST